MRHVPLVVVDIGGTEVLAGAVDFGADRAECDRQALANVQGSCQ